MERAPCCSKEGLHRGPWSVQEDTLLINYIRLHGEGHWRNLPKQAGLLRCGKSCRLRWMNYLRPDIKRGNISSDEEDLIIRLHSLLGNRWSLIAKRLPGRTDNEIKNYWNSHLSKRVETKGVTEPRVIKKRIQSQSANGSKLKKNSANEETTNTKIYLPKAIRISPYYIAIRNMGFDSMGSGSLYGDGEGNIIRAKDTEVALKTEAPCWPHLNDGEQTDAAPNEEYYNSFLNLIDIENNMVDVDGILNYI